MRHPALALAIGGSAPRPVDSSFPIKTKVLHSGELRSVSGALGESSRPQPKKSLKAFVPLRVIPGRVRKNARPWLHGIRETSKFANHSPKLANKPPPSSSGKQSTAYRCSMPRRDNCAVSKLADLDRVLLPLPLGLRQDLLSPATEASPSAPT